MPATDAPRPEKKKHAGGISALVSAVSRHLAKTLFCVLFLLPAAAAKAVEGPMPKFVPAIPIPTVKFSDIGEGGAQGVPWIANYVGGVYEYAAGIALVLAGVMVVIGGFQYQNAGGDSGKVSAARARITDALIGALIVLGAYVMLNTIDTALVKPKPVNIQKIVAQQLAIDKNGGADPTKVGSGPTPEDQQLQQAHDAMAPGAQPAEPPAARIPSSDEKQPTPPPPPANYQPPPEQANKIANLYDPPNTADNPYGVQVKCAVKDNCKPRERMNSICGWFKKNPPKSEQEAIEHALAVLRVWISESINGGAVYVRNNAGNGVAYPDWGFLTDVFPGNTCMQGEARKAGWVSMDLKGYAANDVASSGTCPKTVTDPDSCVPNKWVPGGPPTCGTKKVNVPCTVHQNMQRWYSQCWAKPVWDAGLAGNDCSNYMYSILGCAGFPLKNTARSDAIVGYPGGRDGRLLKPPLPIDPTPWVNALKPYGGPKFLDLYHTRCHTFMYVGGQGLKWTDGRPIYWIEMGGSGVGETLASSGKDIKSGLTTVAGQSANGFKIHFNPSITAHTGLGCYYFDTTKKLDSFAKQLNTTPAKMTPAQMELFKKASRLEYNYVIRPLDQVLGKFSKPTFPEGF